MKNCSFGKTKRKLMTKKNNICFCPSEHGSDTIGWAIFTVGVLLLYIIEIIHKRSFIPTRLDLIALILSIFMLLRCLYDGVYITDKQLYCRKYCIRHRIKISKITALFILDSVSIRRSGTVYQTDKITGEQLKSVVLVKSIDNDMLNRYYNCRSFKSGFPWITYPYFIYDEEFVKLLLEKNPNIRIINKTMGELKIPPSH